MEKWICKTCGTQFPPGETPPPGCPICLDARQYVGHDGQQWTTLAMMQEEGFHNVVKEHEIGLVGIGTEPKFAIGQRALLVQTPEGNILWDCITLLDEQTVAQIERLGGIKAITISHPHYYSAMVDWAERFGVPIYLHESNRRWVMRPSERITFWAGDLLKLPGDISVVRLGGHFPGSTVLHWPRGAGERGVLLTGDTISVVADRNWVSFMYSYPNLIPLPASEVGRIRDAIRPYHFERLYAAWFDTIVLADAREAVIRSADRYIRALEGGYLEEEDSNK
jgi:glyoxylase-like metal-dependent hydrolase (beta-lactamase superfamily II)